MKKAPIPENEKGRLFSLRRYKVLDSQAEPAFDQLTELASRICGVKISLVSLVDSNRQWFKSRFGLEATETPRDVSFCGHAIMTDEVFEIPDASKSPDFCDNPLYLNAPFVRFYAGAPLITPEGYRIGTLCVIDEKPKTLTPLQKDLLKSLAKQVITLFELHTSKEELEKAQEIAKLGGWQFDLKTETQTWTKEHYRIFEIEPPQPQEILYQLYKQRIHPEDLPTLDYLIDRAKRFGEDFIYDHRIHLDNGNRIKYVQGVGRVIKDSDGTPILVTGTCQDRTVEVEYEKKLQQERAKALHASKLASLGEMSAGIAHEINNPLTVIASALTPIVKYRDNPSKFASKIEAIRTSVERIDKIVRGLKKFSRSSDGSDYEICNLSEIIQESLLLVEVKTKRYKTNIYTQLETSGEILCDQVEIEQVLVNLMNNAVDAVKDLADNWVKIHLFETESEVILQVIDSGSGITPEIEAKLFQPFFTTKPVGEGTGLGLSICKGILDQHKASIGLNRSLGNNCFEIHFKKISQNKHVA